MKPITANIAPITPQHKKPTIAAMMFLSKVKDPKELLEKLEELGKERVLKK